MKNIHYLVESSDGHQELIFVHFILTPIKKGANKRLGEYHAHFPKGSSIMKRVMTAVMVAWRIIVEKPDQTG